MAVPKKKSCKVKFKYSLLKRNLQKKLQKNIVNIKNLKQNLFKYNKKVYW